MGVGVGVWVWVGGGGGGGGRKGSCSHFRFVRPSPCCCQAARDACHRAEALISSKAPAHESVGELCSVLEDVSCGLHVFLTALQVGLTVSCRWYVGCCSLMSTASLVPLRAGRVGACSDTRRRQSCDQSTRRASPVRTEGPAVLLGCLLEGCVRVCRR